MFARPGMFVPAVPVLSVAWLVKPIAVAVAGTWRRTLITVVPVPRLARPGMFVPEAPALSVARLVKPIVAAVAEI